MAPRPELDAGPKPITPGPQMQAQPGSGDRSSSTRMCPPSGSADFGEPGYAKTVYALSVCPLADGRSLLAGLMRTATTDEHARRWFRRYWTFGAGGFGAHILVRALLELVRETVERAHTAAQEQAG